MNFWLKSIGAASAPIGDDWIVADWGGESGRTDLFDRVRFARNKRPSGVSRGDRLVFYAAGWERIFGIAIVSSHTPREEIVEGEERWPWVLDVETPLVVPRLSLAPPLSAIQVATTSVRQQSHILLTAEQYALAIEALTRAIQPG